MRSTLQGRILSFLGISLLGLSICFGPVEAKTKRHEKKKFQGGSNPTGIAVIDDDLLLAAQAFGMDLPPDMQVHAPLAHWFATGRGRTVAVLDGGFRLTHPAIAGNVSPFGYDALEDEEWGPDDGDDDDGDYDERASGRTLGHGTFVAGMVLKAAPEATILPIRVRDDEGYGTNEALKRGIRFARLHGVDVINLSVERADCRDSGLASELLKSVADGIVIVVSAGNDGACELNDLARGPGRIAVGAVDGYDQIAPFSNLSFDGRDRQVFAPGVGLHGPLGYPCEDSNGYWSGTSFSAGFVAGAAALARELHPDRAPEEIVETICETSDPAWHGGWPMLEGRGRLNLLSLVLR